MDAIRKRATGLAGLDAASYGGLPAAGTTMIRGAPGTGKTVLALQIAARAVVGGGGAVVASFEEGPEALLQHAASFRFGADLAASDRFVAIDARPREDAVASGAFDIDGLLAALADAAKRASAHWVVLDGIDQLLTLHDDRRAALAALRRVDVWSKAQDVSVLLTAKRDSEDPEIAAALLGTEYLLSTVLDLSAHLVDRRLNRRFRIVKYRGSRHAADELPLLLSDEGVVLPYGLTFAGGGDRAAADSEGTAGGYTDRVGSGITRLDEVLGGGPYRGTTVLISGSPGTSKTTLAAAYIAAAAARGERAYYVSFDELAADVIRNVASVGIDLATPVAEGGARVQGRIAWSALVEEHFVAITNELTEFDPAVLAIDPVSALLKSASAESAYLSVERLLGIARARGITTILTSLGATHDPETEATLSHTSTLADTWIVLKYQVHGGERNRALSVVKSRGTAHSNQVRELLLSDDGIDLEDAYPFGSEVLLGTARMQQERERATQRRVQEFEQARRRAEIEERLAMVEARRREAEREERRLREALERDLQHDQEESDSDRSHASRVLRRRTPGREGEDR